MTTETHDTVDLDAIERSANQLLANRMESVRSLATARNLVEQARADLDEVERADRDARAAAIKAGWSDDELRKVGLPALGLPRRRRRPARGTNPTPHSSPDNGETV